jgi:hypothetical protein
MRNAGGILKFVAPDWARLRWEKFVPIFDISRFEKIPIRKSDRKRSP